MLKSAAMSLSIAILVAAADPTWKPLTSSDRSALEAELKSISSGDAAVACAGSWCRDLASSLATAFASAKWKVTPINHGGIGIDGISGIRIEACGEAKSKLIAAFTKANIKSVWAADDAGPACDNPAIFVVIGRPIQ